MKSFYAPPHQQLKYLDTCAQWRKIRMRKKMTNVVEDNFEMGNWKESSLIYVIPSNILFLSMNFVIIFL